MLIIVGLSSKDSVFPRESLSAIDSALIALGLRRQVRSVMVPEREYVITYDGPTIEKRQIEEIVAPLAERHHLTFTVEIEESIGFP